MPSAHGNRLNAIVAAQEERHQAYALVLEQGPYAIARIHEGPEINAAREVATEAADQYQATFTTEGSWIGRAVRNNLPHTRRNRRAALAQHREAMSTLRQGVNGAVVGNYSLYLLDLDNGMADLS